MQYLVSLLLFFILSSCSNQESFQFSGDWKLQSLSADNEIIPFSEPAPVTSFRSDNLVFYYNTLMRYELTNDSLKLFDEESGVLVRDFKIDFENQDQFSLTFLRKIQVDSINYSFITYNSQWKKTN